MTPPAPPLVKLEARDLAYFAVLAEHGNLRRAAEALDLSQPALSKSLRRLEAAAKTKLVKRTPKGVELTAVGSALLAHARRLRLYLDDVGHEVADLSHGRARHLRIGATPGYVGNPLTPTCTRLLREAPRVTLNITIGGNELLLPALRNGELDLSISGIPASPHKDVAYEHLFDDAFVVYASARHRLANRKQVTIGQLARERWALAGSNTVAHQMLRRALEDGGLPPPTIAMETAAMRPKINLVASSDVLGLTARRFVREAAAPLDLVEIRVQGLPWIRPVGVCHRKDAYLSPAARRFIEILKSTARGLGKES